MSFATRLTDAVAMASTADSVRSDLSTAISTAESSIGAVLTTAGLGSSSVQRAMLEDRLIDLAREFASELADHS